MKYISSVGIILLFPFYISAQSFESIFISIEDFQKEMNKSRLIILQTDKPENYLAGHIPGAMLFQTDQFAVTRDSLYYEIPDVDYFREQLTKCGIDNSSCIFICSGRETFAHAFRLYVTLCYYGIGRQTRIIDGGIRTWESMNLPVSKDTVAFTSVKRNTLRLIANRSILVDKEWIKDNMNDPEITLIDARRDLYYSGSEKGRYLRSGHISTAKNLTWTTLVDENFKLLNKSELAEMFESTGLLKDHILIAYCHVGLRASVIFTVGKALGYTVRLYDGSYNEWDGLDPEKYRSISE
jgi:thiosulfate/3-mercaptopyruvate sulfurtransferase